MYLSSLVVYILPLVLCENSSQFALLYLHMYKQVLKVRFVTNMFLNPIENQDEFFYSYMYILGNQKLIWRLFDYLKTND